MTHKRYVAVPLMANSGATWERCESGWRCIAAETAPILRWMVGKPPDFVAKWLKSNRYNHSWL